MSTSYEKSHLQSKKFVAFLIAEIGWKITLVAALLVWKDNLTALGSGAWGLLLAIVVTAGFVEAGFILGQAALDKYTRVAEIAAGVAKGTLPGTVADTSTTPPTG